MLRVLFVCLGNICRSPAGEAILCHLLEKEGLSEEVEVDSCGVGAWHIGSAPDERMQMELGKRGIPVRSRARQIQQKDFQKFDWILAADQGILRELQGMASSPEERAKVILYTHFSNKYPQQDVPDPYFGERQGFAHVCQMLDESCRALLKNLSG